MKKLTLWFEALFILVALATPAAAQSGDGQQNWFVSASSWGKWASLVTAAGLTTLGALRSNDASDQFRVLEVACGTDASFCRTNSDGIYADPEAERLFQETLRLDGQAQKFLVGGQVTLMLSGAMFLVDLLSDDGGPEDIPFTPLKVFATPRTIGLSVEF